MFSFEIINDFTSGNVFWRPEVVFGVQVTSVYQFYNCMSMEMLKRSKK